MKLHWSLWLVFVIGVIDGEVDYDYFYLVLQWPESYCNTGKVTCYDSPRDHRFTLHGMWPQKNGIFHPSHNLQVQRGSNDLLRRMDRWWPSFNAAHKRSNRPFWKTEWKKHGTCTSFTQSEYFEKAISKAEYLDPYYILSKAGIQPGMQTYTSEIKNEIEMTFNLKPRIHCNEDQYGTVQLYEITFCVDKTGTQFQNCTYSAACNREPIVFPRTYYQSTAQQCSYRS
ncbi:extracellular ribonuclease LE-like [Castanea sativa]|uniref:extracellular ribonuclease LE-like n=1 Tax=Castanea sativa TaxID=21020 RepID=UPI003F64DDDF